MSNIERILDVTSVKIETFHHEIKNNPDKISSQEFNNLTEHLMETHEEISKTLTGTKQPIISQQTLNRISNAIKFVLNEKGAQVKAAALENSLFYETVKEFQNILEELKIKRGFKVEKVTPSSKKEKREDGDNP